MNDKMLKRIIKEELSKVLKEENTYIRPDRMTPEQQKQLEIKVNDLLKDPMFNKLQEKYGIYVSGRDIFKQFGLIINQQTP